MWTIIIALSSPSLWQAITYLPSILLGSDTAEEDLPADDDFAIVELPSGFILGGK